MNKKGIIDKLGITPGPWEVGESYVFQNNRSYGLTVANYKDSHGDFTLSQKERNAHLIAAAPEMLEALIEIILALEEYGEAMGIDLNITHVELLKKATGKSWTETKELIK